MKTPEHLSYWEEECEFSRFVSYCGHDNFWKNHLRKIIMERSHRSILDVGAGVFVEKKQFDNLNYQIEYSATEITNKFVEYGKSIGINVAKTDFDVIPFDSNRFDVVICYDVLNHQLDFKTLVQEMIRVARKDVIITFFKPFAEDFEAQNEIKRSINAGMRARTVKNVGIILDRVVSKINADIAICTYNYFYRENIENFLKDQSNISFDFFTVTNPNNPSEIRRCCLITKNLQEGYDCD